MKLSLADLIEMKRSLIKTMESAGIDISGLGDHLSIEDMERMSKEVEDMMKNGPGVKGIPEISCPQDMANLVDKAGELAPLFKVLINSDNQLHEILTKQQNSFQGVIDNIGTVLESFEKEMIKDKDRITKLEQQVLLLNAQLSLPLD
jgi:hypothetical protein